MFDSGKIVNTLIGAFIGITLFGVFFPMITEAFTGMGLDNVTLFGTVYDFSWIGYLVILGVLFILLRPAVDSLRTKIGR